VPTADRHDFLTEFRTQRVSAAALVAVGLMCF